MATASAAQTYDLPHEGEVRAVLRRYGVRRAQLFGSAARGELTPTSDIDMLIDLPGPLDYAVLLRLSEELEAATGRRVDLLTSIKPVFRPYIEPDLVEIVL
ncbi:nucleotidyltransferase family protein [Tomitella fengzijianii]|uniref:Nucleotidyltransferase domain-containing protein n=1 Tax=Tomitella fengzijianii TaxID=2597660 RepID=A0A516X6M4_9ACTN|nr:nucleotidyltransferase domain-containing protein [Tomitella fengzijianii]QDQ98719.1 nucleotidyltransferase domain-containing protein [Tomitella fengzijianii]